MWHSESPTEVARELRRKGEYSDGFLEYVIDSAKTMHELFPLVMLDLGGKISRENEK